MHHMNREQGITSLVVPHRLLGADIHSCVFVYILARKCDDKYRFVMRQRVPVELRQCLSSRSNDEANVWSNCVALFRVNSILSSGLEISVSYSLA